MLADRTNSLSDTKRGNEMTTTTTRTLEEKKDELRERWAAELRRLGLADQTRTQLKVIDKMTPAEVEWALKNGA
jgi:hypothetical protein